MRLYADGCRLVKAMRVAGARRGLLSITQEQLEGHPGSLLVARLNNAGGVRGIPPLYNVTLAGISSQAWLLRGFERLESGPMRRACLLGQFWLAEPAVVQDLIDVETKWTNAVREANELRERLAALNGGVG